MSHDIRKASGFVSTTEPLGFVLTKEVNVFLLRVQRKPFDGNYPHSYNDLFLRVYQMCISSKNNTDTKVIFNIILYLFLSVMKIAVFAHINFCHESDIP